MVEIIRFIRIFVRSFLSVVITYALSISGSTLTITPSNGSAVTAIQLCGITVAPTNSNISFIDGSGILFSSAWETYEISGSTIEEKITAIEALIAAIDCAGGGGFDGNVTIVADDVGLNKEATQIEVLTELQEINGKDFATEATLEALNTKDFATETTLQNLDSKDFSTEATLSAVNINLGTDTGTPPSLGTGIRGWLRGIYDQAVLILAKLGQIFTAQSDGSQKTQVTNFPATQPVSGTVTVSGSVTVSGTVNAAQSGTWNITNITGTISLPTGASTAVLQTTGNNYLSSIDAKMTNGTAITQIIGGTTANTTSTTLVGTTINVPFLTVAANPNRRGLVFTNNSNKTVLICLGATVSSTLFSYSIAAGAVLEVPLQLAPLSLSAVWVAGGAANGSVIVTISNA